MTSSHPTPAPCQWFDRLAAALDRRSAPRLALRFLGTVLARGRRTVTTWIRAAGLSGRYQSCYIAVAAGKRADRIARRLLTEVVQPLLKGATRLTLALDETPTKRYGPQVVPRVYYRLTDNWLELSVRFITEEHGIREIKDAMSREILEQLDEAGISIASTTIDITGLPPLRLARERTRQGRENGQG